MSPSLIVSIWGIWVLGVIRTLNVQLWVIWVMGVELDLPLEGREMVAMHLISESPEASLPNLTGLGILESQVILIVWTLRASCEIEIGDVEPERYHSDSTEKRPALEPSLRVNVIESPIRVSLKWSSDWKSVGGVLLGQYTESIDNIWDLLRHLSEDSLLEVPVLGIGNSLL